MIYVGQRFTYDLRSYQMVTCPFCGSIPIAPICKDGLLTRVFACGFMYSGFMGSARFEENKIIYTIEQACKTPRHTAKMLHFEPIEDRFWVKSEQAEGALKRRYGQ